MNLKGAHRWTGEQLEAIRQEGDVLVCAAAGAGKTSVLTARLERLVEEGVPLERVLVITFTEAAALELASRIGSSIARDRARYLSLQLGWISTIHAFCRRFLKENALEAGLSPLFRIQDEDESLLLTKEVAFELLGKWVADPFIRALVDEYAEGNPDRFVSLLRRISDFLTTLPNPTQWTRETRRRLREESFCLDGYVDFVKTELNAMASEARLRAELIRNRYKQARSLSEILEDFASSLSEAIRAKDYESLRSSLSSGKFFPRLPQRAKNCDESQWKAAKELLCELREEFQKALNDFFAAGREEIVKLERDLVPKACAFLRLAWEIACESKRRRKELNALNFSDLEHEALRLVEEKDPESVKDLFQQVLVDEFQDVNPLQDKLIERVAPEGRSFLVGDPRQSIYRFRLAEPRIFARKIEEARQKGKAKLVTLSTNFRSKEPILNFVNKTFSFIMHEGLDGIGFEESAELKAGREEKERRGSFGPPFVEVHILDGEISDSEEGEDLEKVEREGLLIAQRLISIKEKGFSVECEEGVRDLTWSDFAILLRAVKWRVESLARVLEENGIPVSGPGSSDPFSTIEMRDLRSLLQVLDNPRQDIPLAAVMLSPFGGFKPKDLALLRGQDSDRPFHALVLEGDTACSQLREKVTGFKEKLRRWRRTARDRPLSEALVKILSESNYLAYLSTLPLSAQRRSNVVNFVERARKFGRFSRQGLDRFLSYLDDIAERGSELGPSRAEETGAEAVSILSIHQSKGLEWPVVVVADLGRRFNLREFRQKVLVDREEGIALQWVNEKEGIRQRPPRYLMMEDKKRCELLAEEMRLLYVAFTRAREKLILVGTEKVERARQRIEFGEKGPFLSRGRVKRACSPLHWLIPAFSNLNGSILGLTPDNQPPCFESSGLAQVSLTFYTETPRPSPTKGGKSPELDPSKVKQTCEVLTKLLTFNYPYASDTTQQAVFTVTEFKEGIDLSEFEQNSAFSQLRPAFLTSQDPLGRGIAVHRFLQHFDPRKRPQAELERLCLAGVISPEEKELIDLEAVDWFLKTELGKVFSRAQEKLRREVPFICRLGPPDSAVLVRGVIDAVILDADTVCLLDFKTDEVRSEEQLQERVKIYRPQVKAYAWALARILRRRVSEAYLVFLNSKRIVSVEEACREVSQLEKELKELTGARALKPFSTQPIAQSS